MVDFFKENAVWVTPVLVAIVTGVFYLLKKGGNSNKQTISNVKNSKITQTNSQGNKSAS